MVQKTKPSGKDNNSAGCPLSDSQQVLGGVVDPLEIEPVKDLIKVSLYLVVAKVTDASFVGVLNGSGRMVIPVFNFLAYLHVCIPERHTVEYTAVHFFHAEQVPVLIVLKQVLLYLYMRQHQGHHAHAAHEVTECGEQQFLEQLHVAVIAGGEICRQQCDIVGQCRNLIATRANKLEHIRILFVGHNARTCRKVIGEAYKSEILIHKEAGIHREPCQRAGDVGKCRRHNLLHLSSSHLRIDYVVVKCVKAQQLRGHGTV